MATDRTPTLRVAGAQIVNAVGDLEGNVTRIRDAMAWAEEEAADVVVFPELALTGYPPGDLVLRSDFLDAAREALDELAAASGSTTAIVSTVDRVPPRRSWDTQHRHVAIGAAVLCDGELRGWYHKVLLPTYELFDEARHFAPGVAPGRLWRLGDAVVGVAICEDLWSGDGPPEAQAIAGAQAMLVPNASPFHREKPGGRRRLVTQVARRNGVPVVYVNGVGGQDELVFDGGSIVVSADGELLHRSPQFRPDLFVVDVALGPRRPVDGRPITVHSRATTQREVRPAPRELPVLSDDEQVWEALVLGTRDFVRRNGARAVTLGLSGGIDAAVTAAVAAEALGPERVLGVAMPAEDGDEELADARELARGLGIRFAVVPIAPITERLEAGVASVLDEDPDALREHSALEARTRAAVLWALADQRGLLPLATGNKSELSIGTGASAGDMSGSFAPLKDCPKTLLYRLARLRNARDGAPIPDSILERPATVHAAPGTDLPPYEVLDAIVERYLEKGEAVEALVQSGYDEAVVRGVLQLVDDAELKRRQTPPGVKITARTFGQDLHMPIANDWRPFRREGRELGSELLPS
jgi:NAD+ synthase (glutamine-hydrolysing)